MEIEYEVLRKPLEEDDLPTYHCKTCEDTHQVVVGRGTEDEEVKPCPDCSLDEEGDFTGPVLGDNDR